VRGEHLNHAFFLELGQSLLELLLPRHLLGPKRGEVFRCEAGNRREFDRCAGGHGIPDAEEAGIDEPDDVAGIGHVDSLALAREEAVRTGHAHLAAEA
jgi:hypothetical protein